MRESQHHALNKQLPRRQNELLGLIARDIRAGRTPVVAELIKTLGLARESSLDNLLLPLHSKGLIAINGGVRGRQREIALTDAGRALTRVGIPVLGRIPAGPVAEALEEVEEWLDGFSPLLPYQPDDFLLRVKGDSMIEDGILSGDRVLLRPNVQVQNGEIAAVQIDQGDGIYQGTLKHVHFRVNGRSVRLRAANPKYDDLLIPAEKVMIAGVFRGLVRLPFEKREPSLGARSLSTKR